MSHKRPHQSRLIVRGTDWITEKGLNSRKHQMPHYIGIVEGTGRLEFVCKTIGVQYRHAMVDDYLMLHVWRVKNSYVLSADGGTLRRK